MPAIRIHFLAYAYGKRPRVLDRRERRLSGSRLQTVALKHEENVRLQIILEANVSNGPTLLSTRRNSVVCLVQPGQPDSCRIVLQA